jgi:superfamily II DNA or RNA helicase
MALLTELLQRLHSDPGIRGRQFEKLCKWYFETEPTYRLQLKRIWLWKEWPERWSNKDLGIDLVVETLEGKRWAIQAKAYDSNYYIKKADIDSFLSESSRPEFSYRLVLATTNLLGPNAQTTINAQQKPVGKVLFSDLCHSALSWPESPDELLAPPPERKEPRIHQEKAVEEALQGFKKHDRGQIIMACATGKTLVGLWVRERIESQRTLVLVPSLSIMHMALREWAANSSLDFIYLPVCSDDTVGEKDSWTSKTSDLGFPVTTDPFEIANFMKKKGNLVVFSTYQSSPKISEAFSKYNIPSFDLVVADEAHRCAAPRSGPFNMIVDGEKIKAKKRLFMTATPRFFADSVKRQVREAGLDVVSMDDVSFFGPVFSKLSFSEAIKRDLVTDYKVVIVGVNNPTYRQYAERGTYVTFDGETITDAHNLGSHIALAKAIAKYELRKIISFHGRVQRAKTFGRELPRVIDWMPQSERPSGNLWSGHVAGHMPAGQREMRLQRFEQTSGDDRVHLANARCLGEGVNIPNLDGVIFVDPKRSQLEVIQAVGRVIRKSPEKKVGTVIVPVFIDDSKDSEEILNGSAFRPVWSVLKALRAHDDALAEELDQIRREKGRHVGRDVQLPKKIIWDLPVSVGSDFVEALKVRIVEESTAAWEFWYGLLETYIQEHGHALVPAAYVTEDGYPIGTWVNKQRRDYGWGTLPIDRKKSLETIEGWTWDHKDFVWFDCVDALTDFVQKHGHLRVPKSLSTSSGVNLQLWIRNQRMKRSNLSQDKVKALEAIPCWTWKVQEDRFQTGLDHFLTFVEQNGHGLVPQDHVTEEGFKLGQWVSTRRTLQQGNKLSSAHQQRLERTQGWAWNPSEYLWFECFEHLREFAACLGHTNVPKEAQTLSGATVHFWIGKPESTQRKPHERTNKSFGGYSRMDLVYQRRCV